MFNEKHLVPSRWSTAAKWVRVPYQFKQLEPEIITWKDTLKVRVLCIFCVILPTIFRGPCSISRRSSPCLSIVSSGRAERNGFWFELKVRVSSTAG